MKPIDEEPSEKPADLTAWRIARAEHQRQAEIADGGDVPGVAPQTGVPGGASGSAQESETEDVETEGAVVPGMAMLDVLRRSGEDAPRAETLGNERPEDEPQVSQRPTGKGLAGEDVMNEDDAVAPQAVREAATLISEGLAAFDVLPEEQRDALFGQLDRSRLEDFLDLADAYIDAHPTADVDA
jgi:hypothetical protein